MTHDVPGAAAGIDNLEHVTGYCGLGSMTGHLYIIASPILPSAPRAFPAVLPW